MSSWTSLITNRGRALQAKAQAGAPLQFTRFRVGDGRLTSQSIPALTELISPIKYSDVKRLRYSAEGGNQRTLIGTDISTAGLTTGFFFREFGIYAMDPDLGEILYWYGNAGDTADYITPEGAGSTIDKVFNVLIYIGAASQVSAAVDQSIVYVTQQEFEEAIASITVPLIDSTTSTSKTSAPTADALRVGLLQKLDKSRLISTRSRIYHDVAAMNISTTLSGAIAVTFPSSASGMRVTLSIRAATGSDYWRLMVSLIIPSISTAPVSGLLTAAEGSFPAGVTVSAGRSNGRIVVLIGDLNSTWYGGMQVFVDDVAAFGSSAPALDGGVWALSSYTSSSTVITPDITATPGKPVTTADATSWQKWAITTEFGTAKSITGVDLNDYKRDGRYYGANLTNAPSSAYYFIEVMAFNDYNVRQIARSSDGLTYQERFLKGVGGTWSAWSEDLFALKKDYVRMPGYAATAGTGAAYTVTLDPAPTALVDGMSITIIPHVNNTAVDPTLALNSLIARPIRRQNGGQFAAGTIKAGQPLSLVKVGNYFLARSAAPVGNATAAQVLAGYTFQSEVVPDGGTGTAKPDKSFFGSYVTNGFQVVRVGTPLTLFALNGINSGLLIAPSYNTAAIDSIFQLPGDDYIALEFVQGSTVITLTRGVTSSSLYSYTELALNKQQGIIYLRKSEAGAPNIMFSATNINLDQPFSIRLRALIDTNVKVQATLVSG